MLTWQILLRQKLVQGKLKESKITMDVEKLGQMMERLHRANHPSAIPNQTIRRNVRAIKPSRLKFKKRISTPSNQKKILFKLKAKNWEDQRQMKKRLQN